MKQFFKITFLFVIFLYLSDNQVFSQETSNWGKIDYKGEPWVENLSRPYEITQGLHNRHLSLWASHGRYYDLAKGYWKWQRPNLFCTTEDLFTPTIVVPYLIPMLENAGAVVFTPRERDWQTEEVIVDNDNDFSTPYYKEDATRYQWTNTGEPGFSKPTSLLTDGVNPFVAGTARMVQTTKNKRKKQPTTVSYQPHLREAGNYAVYVSYQTVKGSVPDAEYTIYHKGIPTIFHVNQQMGGGTWVYLGTFDFDAGCNTRNCVVLSNESRHDGVVTTDAIRFGGGMGNIERGGATSGLPRALEGARYYAQWAGAPYSVYSSKEGTDDYKDDINVRSFMTNWLAGGSPYVPNTEGKHVPLELSLAIHSDAGFAPDGNSLVGSLSICTTTPNEGLFQSGASRTMSHDLAEALLSNVTQDLSRIYGRWERRYLWDRNYSETRCPEVPSAIFETLSHQNFPDMIYAQDPNFKFNLARSIYKTLLRFINDKHGRPSTIQPLAPVNFRIDVSSNGKAHLQWSGVADALEPTAHPASYNIYTAIGNNGFDNGQNVHSTSVTMELIPDIQYNFRITAVNKGGESFPSETLSVVWHGANAPKVLVINGFRRLSAPAIYNDGAYQGFDMSEDPGVSYGLTAGWAGEQQYFDTAAMGIEGEGGLGYGGNELAGQFVAGNTFNYVKEHTEAIATAKKYNIVSCSSTVVEGGQIDLKDYDCIDLILGAEKYTSHQLKPYKTFSPLMQQKLREYTQHNGRLLVSGSYIGSDMRTETERLFLQNVLKLSYGGNERNNKNEHVAGLGKQFHIYRSLNKYHYACTSPEILNPLHSSFCAMQYGDGQSAGVAYDGNDYKLFVTGFPLECIKEQQARYAIMRGTIAFLLK